MFFVNLLLFCCADKGTDPPELVGNDGRPKFNYIGYNTIFSDRDEVAKVTEADENIFEVCYCVSREFTRMYGRCFDAVRFYGMMCVYLVRSC